MRKGLILGMILIYLIPTVTAPAEPLYSSRSESVFAALVNLPW